MTGIRLERIRYLLRSDKILRQRLAKYIGLHCFRNTRLEDFHVGLYPSSAAGDYSDVKVVSPFGEIPWSTVSRLDDAEMQELMIDVVRRCYEFVNILADAQLGPALLEVIKKHDVAPSWYDPV